MAYFYSPSENIAYPKELMDSYIEAGTLPDDLLEITDDDFQKYFIEIAPTGKYRTADKHGLPTWADVAPPSKEYLIAIAKQEKQNRVDLAMNSIAVLQLKLQAGRKLTPHEMAQLNAVLDYIDKVNDIDTSTAPDITWPDKLE